MSKFNIIKLIGKGSYGNVYQVSDVNNKIYALKKINIKSSNCDNKGTLTELHILFHNRSENLVKFYESYIENFNLCIITEFYENNDLLQLIKKKKKKKVYFNEDFIWRIFIDILLGIKYLHDNDIIHRDLKSANIFIDKNLRAIIGDFGVSKILNDNVKTYTQIGTPLYLSPEIINKNKYDKKIDIWSLGCILYEIIALDQPFISSKSFQALYSKIISGNFPKIYNNLYSKDLLSMIDILLEVNPKKRISIDELLSLSIIKNKLYFYNDRIEVNYNDIPNNLNNIPNNFQDWKNIINIYKIIPVNNNLDNYEKKQLTNNFKSYEKKKQLSPLNHNHNFNEKKKLNNNFDDFDIYEKKDQLSPLKNNFNNQINKLEEIRNDYNIKKKKIEEVNYKYNNFKNINEDYFYDKKKAKQLYNNKYKNVKLDPLNNLNNEKSTNYINNYNPNNFNLNNNNPYRKKVINPITNNPYAYNYKSPYSQYNNKDDFVIKIGAKHDHIYQKIFNKNKNKK